MVCSFSASSSHPPGLQVAHPIPVLMPLVFKNKNNIIKQLSINHEKAALICDFYIFLPFQLSKENPLKKKKPKPLSKPST